MRAYYALLLLLWLGLSHIPAFGQKSWEQINAPDDGLVFSLFVNSQDIVFAGTGGGIFRSSDMGDSWSNTTCKSGWAHSIFDFAEDSKGRLYASAASGVFISKDNGASWSMVKDDYMARQVETDEKDNIYITASSQSNEYHVSKSSDAGKSWIDITPGGSNISLLALCVVNSNLIVLSIGDEILYTTDKGTTWEQGGEVDGNLYFNSIVSVSDKIIGNARHDNISIGIYESPDGRQWHVINAFPETISFNWLKADKYHDKLYAFDRNMGIYKSGDKGYTWNGLFDGFPAKTTLYDIAFSKSGRLIASASNQRLYRLSDGAGITEGREIYQKTSVTIYPNPSDGNFNIKSSCMIDNIGVYDLSGRKLTNFQYSGTYPNSIAASVKDILPGLYYLKFHANGNTFFKSIIVTSD